MVRHFALQRVSLGAIALAMASTAAVAEEPPDGTYHPSKAGQVRKADSTGSTVQVKPAAAFSNAFAVSAGVGLRNMGGGGVTIGGVSRPIKAAFLYWAVITNGSPTTANAAMKIQRVAPSASVVTTLKGTIVGSGDTPCWGGTGVTVYRATVPTSVATGTGSYSITAPTGGSGLTDGEDPWTSGAIYPLLDGASLVIIGSGSSNVVVFDKALSGDTFVSPSGFTYRLDLPSATTSARTILDAIGADGQIGAGRTITAGLGTKVVSVNGTAISGPGTAAPDSDWNGRASLPLPQLWDDVSHDISGAVAVGSRGITVNIIGGNDCLVPVASVVTYGQSAPP